jgi:hypothetical protein
MVSLCFSVGQRSEVDCLYFISKPVLLFAVPEIEQGLSDAAGKPVQISFTPHLIPMVSYQCPWTFSVLVSLAGCSVC